MQSGVGRTGPVWAIEHYGVEPDLLVSGKSLGGGLPLAAVTGRAEVMDAPDPGGLGGTFGGNPVACAAALAVLDEVATRRFRARAEELGAQHAHGARGARGPDATRSAKCAASARCCALELVTDRETKEPAADAREAHDRGGAGAGLILLSCGTLGNVIRILVPLVISDDDLDRGLEILEESLVDAGRRLTFAWKARRRSASRRPTATSWRSTGSTSRSRQGEFFTMLGPSGSGKTTTLRLIAGFERPDEGRVVLNGADVTGSRPTSAT